MWTLYQHHKGLFYLGLGSGNHSETMDAHAIYLALYDNPRGRLWIRPSSMFFDNGGPRNSKRFAAVKRLRRLALNEADSILSFGFDAWGAGRTLENFIQSYETNKNHLRGQRYVLETLSGEPLATINTLRFTPDVVGLAWLATHPEHRKNGHASLLLNAVMALLRNENENLTFLLHSEIGIRFYEKFGFEKLPAEHQHFEKSVAMATEAPEDSAEYGDFLREFF